MKGVCPPLQDSIQILYSSTTVEPFCIYAKLFIYCQTLHTWLLTDCEIERSNNVIYKTRMRDERLFAALHALSIKLITYQKQVVRERGTEGQ